MSKKGECVYFVHGGCIKVGFSFIGFTKKPEDELENLKKYFGNDIIMRLAKSNDMESDFEKVKNSLEEKNIEKKSDYLYCVSCTAISDILRNVTEEKKLSKLGSKEKKEKNDEDNDEEKPKKDKKKKVEKKDDEEKPKKDKKKKKVVEEEDEEVEEIEEDEESEKEIEESDKEVEEEKPKKGKKSKK